MLQGTQQFPHIILLNFTDFIQDITVDSSKALINHHKNYRKPKIYFKINKAFEKLYKDSEEFKKYFNKPLTGSHQPYLTLKKNCQFNQGWEILELLQLIVTIEEWKVGKKLDLLFSSMTVIPDSDNSVTLNFIPFYKKFYSSFSLSANFIINRFVNGFVTNIHALCKEQGQLPDFSLHPGKTFVTVKKFEAFNAWFSQVFNFSIIHTAYFTPHLSITEEPMVFPEKDVVLDEAYADSADPFKGTFLEVQKEPDWHSSPPPSPQIEPLSFPLNLDEGLMDRYAIKDTHFTIDPYDPFYDFRGDLNANIDSIFAPPSVAPTREERSSDPTESEKRTASEPESIEKPATTLKTTQQDIKKSLSRETAKRSRLSKKQIISDLEKKHQQLMTEQAQIKQQIEDLVLQNNTLTKERECLYSQIKAAGLPYKPFMFNIPLQKEEVICVKETSSKAPRKMSFDKR